MARALTANHTKTTANRALMRYAAAVALLLAVGRSCSRTYPDITGSAELLRAAALDQAKKEHKQVFLLFTAPDCDWCKQYDAYHEDPNVMRIIGKYFVLLQIDVYETPGGEHLFGEHGGSDKLPLFSILDPNGMLLANSGEGDGNIGFPTKPSEVAAYFAALKSACPNLGDDEIRLLRQKLEYLGSAKRE